MRIFIFLNDIQHVSIALNQQHLILLQTISFTKYLIDNALYNTSPKFKQIFSPFLLRHKPGCDIYYIFLHRNARGY